MKRNISLLMGALAVALVPALAQQPAAAPGGEAQGKVHGHVTNPTGAPQNGGTVAAADMDGDGVPDSIDNCKTEKNPNQADEDRDPPVSRRAGPVGVTSE